MQNPKITVNSGTISSGIVPPPVQSQPLNMQSTTPSVINGKDEMRGWLYKWTNVKIKLEKFFFSRIFCF